MGEVIMKLMAPVELRIPLYVLSGSLALLIQKVTQSFSHLRVDYYKDWVTVRESWMMLIGSNRLRLRVEILVDQLREFVDSDRCSNA
jgi:hypothetical protein